MVSVSRLEFVKKDNNRKGYAVYKCLCGQEISLIINSVNSGNTKSCGCLKRDRNKEVKVKHGKSGDLIYRAWINMKARCYLVTGKKYKDYGGRGIKVCDRWINSFESFYADMGERPFNNYSLERMDVEGDYCPENCIWASSKTQARNRRNTIYYDIEGESKTLAEWCDIYGTDYKLAHERITRGWDFVKAITYKKL